VPAISWRLTVNDREAPSELISAIRQIEVEDHSRMADMLRLQIAIAVKEDGSGWTVLDDDLFQRLTKIKVEISLENDRYQPLINAHVIEARANLSDNPGNSILRIVAMDPTVLLSLDEKVKPWPNMTDSEIAEAIFADYGFQANVDPTNISHQEEDVTTIQRGTDMQFLKMLAARYGFECYIETDPSSGAIVGHFHAPRLDETPQGTLFINMGPVTNVNSFLTKNEMILPVQVQATSLDIESQTNQPADIAETSLHNMGSIAPSQTDRPRTIILSGTGLSQAGELQTYAQAVVDKYSWSITAEGELNTVAYNGILKAKSPILVKGAGNQFSGRYYVDRVLHILTGDGYLQRFSLRRNALGFSSNENSAGSQALNL